MEKASTEHTLLLETLPVPILKENEILLCEEDPTEKEFYEAIMSMAQEKSSGKD